MTRLRWRKSPKDRAFEPGLGHPASGNFFLATQQWTDTCSSQGRISQQKSKRRGMGSSFHRLSPKYNGTTAPIASRLWETFTFKWNFGTKDFWKKMPFVNVYEGLTIIHHTHFDYFFTAVVGIRAPIRAPWRHLISLYHLRQDHLCLYRMFSGY